ncbi:hypothetical protein BKA70DRAFT_605615 [Coprinopsis sp. MPI-PUGE-AT-0042]|nr:hypothetical protein BKA70DRAFT_605615 [Coprinopsis sp. MPI-PUGE-AT-0042]
MLDACFVCLVLVAEGGEAAVDLVSDSDVTGDHSGSEAIKAQAESVKKDFFAACEASGFPLQAGGSPTAQSNASVLPPQADPSTIPSVSSGSGTSASAPRGVTASPTSPNSVKVSSTSSAVSGGSDVGFQGSAAKISVRTSLAAGVLTGAAIALGMYM